MRLPLAYAFPRSGLVLRAAQRELRRLVMVWVVRVEKNKPVRTCPVVDNLETGDDGRGWRGGGGGGYSKGQEGKRERATALSTFLRTTGAELGSTVAPNLIKERAPFPQTLLHQGGREGRRTDRTPLSSFTEREGGTRLRGFLCTVLEEGSHLPRTRLSRTTTLKAMGTPAWTEGKRFPL
jgi:hypothetical protein